MNAPTEETIYDAIVVGAGPAGCSTALFLARAGRQVLLLDKASFPREKVCGDAISGKSVGVLNELGLFSELGKPAHGVIQGVALIAPNGKEVRVKFQPATGCDFAGYTLRRIQTDEVLYKAATKEKNVHIGSGCRVASLLKDASGMVQGVECEVEEKKKEGAKEMASAPTKKSYRARVVVGADGSASIVARQVGVPPLPPEHQFMAIRGYWRGVTNLSDHIELFFIDGVLPGYLWIFPMGDGTANVGLGVLLHDMKKRGVHVNKILLDALANHPSLKERFVNSKLEGQIGAWIIPNGSFKRQNVGEGWALVGDAAALVDPFSGEGYGNAVSSGKFVAQTIDAALKARQTAAASSETAPPQSLRAAELSPYSARVDEELRPEMETHYKLQQASRHKFILNQFITKAATKPEIRKVVQDMLASDEEKKKAASIWFYIKLLLPW